LLHAGPGAGKTLGALLGFQRLLREGHLDRLLVFSHRTSIARQWLVAAGRLGLHLQDWDPQAPQAGAEGRSDGWLLSYQGAARHQARLLRELPQRLAGLRWLAIADEVHHLGLDPETPDATAWAPVFTALTAGAQLRLGLSGTPFRADALAFCAARRIRVLEADQTVERIVPDLCVEPQSLILAGDVRPLEFRFQDGWVEHGRFPTERDRETSPLSQEERQSWRARNLRRAIQPGNGAGIAQRLLIQARRRLETVRRQHPAAGGLVIARDIQHARQITHLLAEEGEAPLLVHSQDPEAAARLAAFRAGEGRWLVSIDMCAEGFDAPRLRVVVYLSTVVTRSRFVQAITRAVRIDGERSALESIPRDPSYVFAPADPLLIAHARTWSRSEPYLVRPSQEGGSGSDGVPGVAVAPLAALADGAGAVIRMGGAQLPDFLRRPA
jgi:superfamily II DNA or RNA helicase